MKKTNFAKVNIRINLINALLIMFVFVILMSCKNDEDLQLDSKLLQGIWVEIEPQDVIQFVGTNHTFTFYEDSFYLKKRYWNDAIDPQDTCPLCPKFAFIKGKYKFDEETISFNGEYFVDSNYVFHTAYNYNEIFGYDFKKLDKLILLHEIKSRNIALVRE